MGRKGEEREEKVGNERKRSEMNIKRREGKRWKEEGR